MKTIDIIRNYYKNDDLEVLNYNKDDYKNVYIGDSYKAVSLEYIYKYVLKERISMNFIAKQLAKLCKEEFILPIPCDFANNLVFCKYSYSKHRYFDKFKFINNKIEASSYYKNNIFYMTKINNFNKLIEL